MKFIILPILKFICAIIFTIVFSIILAVFIPLYMIWNLKFPELTYEIGAGFDFSPYYRRNPNYFGSCEFKTYYHYVWGYNPIN